MKALGWGDIIVESNKKKEVTIASYPWTSLYNEKNSFPFIRGAFSGFYGTNFNIGKETILEDLHISMVEA